MPADGRLDERIRLFFGNDIGNKLYVIDADKGPARLFGYIADPACERGNARMQYLFLNGRWIRDRSLGHALQEGYRGLLMTGRYAVAFLFLELPADQVDVNVHPTKAEVRFRDSQALYSFVLATVRDRLRAENLTPRFRPAKLHAGRRHRRQVRCLLFQTRAAENAGLAVWAGNGGVPAVEVGPGSGERAGGCGDPRYAPGKRRWTQAAGQRRWPVQKSLQLHNAYLVLETPDGMLIVDQHALHERILFEQLKGTAAQRHAGNAKAADPRAGGADRRANGPHAGTPRRVGRAGLRSRGIRRRHSGDHQLSRPAGGRSPAETLRSVVDYLTGKGRIPTREQFLSEIMSLMACHAAVRSGDPLTPDEIDSLIAMRHLAQDAHHCPHGRPTALLFTRHDLDRQFRRV